MRSSQRPLRRSCSRRRRPDTVPATLETHCRTPGRNIRFYFPLQPSFHSSSSKAGARFSSFLLTRAGILDGTRRNIRAACFSSYTCGHSLVMNKQSTDLLWRSVLCSSSSHGKASCLSYAFLTTTSTLSLASSSADRVNFPPRLVFMEPASLPSI